MQDTFETDVTVTSLEPFTLYTVQVQASNFYSESPTTLLPSNVNHFMTKPGSQYTQSVRHYHAARDVTIGSSAIDRDCFPIISVGNLYQETRSSSVFICASSPNIFSVLVLALHDNDHVYMSLAMALLITCQYLASFYVENTSSSSPLLAIA